MTPPPVSSWPSEVFQDEPAHGFFQRLASANGQISCRTFAACLALNGRNYDFEQILEFCSALPTPGVGKLYGSTPQRSVDAVTLRGETFSPAHFAFISVRVCPACLSQSRYHRNWFDFSFIQNCPVHDLPLVDGTPHEKLARWYPGVGVLPHSGVDLAKPSPLVAQAPATLARYVLGRIGCLPEWSVSYLDRYTCGEIVQMSEIIGRMRAFGWQSKLNAHGKWDSNRRLRAEDGFSVLCAGPDAISAALASFTAGSPVKSSSATISFAIGDFYGWLTAPVRELSKTPLGADFQSMMLMHANRSGVFARKGYQAAIGSTGVETLSSLGRKLGITHFTVKEFARHVGVLRSTSDKRRNHSISPADTAKIVNFWADLVLREDAENIVQNSGLGDLSDLERTNLIRPIMRYGGRSATNDRFQRSMLSRLSHPAASPDGVSKLKSHGS